MIHSKPLYAKHFASQFLGIPRDALCYRCTCCSPVSVCLGQSLRLSVRHQGRIQKYGLEGVNAVKAWWDIWGLGCAACPSPVEVSMYRKFFKIDCG